MNRRVLTAYYIISAAFLLLIVSLGTYRLLVRAEENLRASRRSLEALRITTLSAYLSEGGFDSEHFRSRVSESFRAADRLRLLAVYSEDEGLLYLLSRSRGLLRADPGAEPSVAGVPEYDLTPLVHVRLSVPFSPGIRRGLVIDGVFLRLDREDLYPILRELFVVLIAYLAVTTVLLLIAALSRPAAARASDPEAAARRRAGPHRLAAPRGPGSPPLPSDPAVPEGETAARANAAHPGLYSPDSGLGWRDFLPERLTHELERAASFDQDLTLLLVGVRPGAAEGSVDRASYLYGQLGKYTLESFPLRDLAFEYDPHAVAVILPDRSLDRGLEEARAVQRKLLDAPWLGVKRVRVCAGLSSRSGRLISGTRLLIEAGRSLRKAESGGANQVVAFKADPHRFRQAVASSQAQPPRRR